jgi:ubiquinone/menaquinone biosynthesis C-methylase UbiE
MDVDAGILERARVKLAAADVRAELLCATAHDLPLADASVEVAITSLVLHHLTPREKRLALAELFRVLQHGGRLIVVDWGKPTGPLTRIGFQLLRMLDGFANTADHAAGQIAGNYCRSRVRRFWQPEKLVHGLGQARAVDCHPTSVTATVPAADGQRTAYEFDVRVPAEELTRDALPTLPSCAINLRARARPPR